MNFFIFTLAFGGHSKEDVTRSHLKQGVVGQRRHVRQFSLIFTSVRRSLEEGINKTGVVRFVRAS